MRWGMVAHILIPALKRLRQEDLKLKVTLCYMGNTAETLLKKRQKSGKYAATFGVLSKTHIGV
jgi:hypothetical protein